MRIMEDDIYIVGIGMPKFGKFLDKSIKDLSGIALSRALEDSGLGVSEIECAWFSNSTWGVFSFQHMIRGEVALFPHGIEKIPFFNVENACAGASTALHGAWMAIKAGLYDCTLALGAEKMFSEDRALSMRAFTGATDMEVSAKTIAYLKKLAEEKKKKDAEQGKKPESKKGGHSAFMDFYAAGARNHMKKYGMTQRHLAIIAAKNHNNSTMNPLAQYTFPQTVEQVMNDYEVAFPLTRAMCAPIGDGAAAAIVCSESFLNKHPELKERAVLIRASILRSGSLKDDDMEKRTMAAAWKMANRGRPNNEISLKDIEVAELHDATAFGELDLMERVGICPRGEGGPFVETGATELTGEIPINPSGGLLARGHPIGASGLAQIHELVTQLRGEAGKRQVKNHTYALAENGGGSLGRGSAAQCIHILEIS
ncbi:MAG: thiolase family protein [Promethearchaeota archaeon]